MASDSRRPAPILCNPSQTPPWFHGDVFKDAEDCLAAFERKALYNGFNDEHKLSNVYFALEESARTWFANHEIALYTYAMFCRDFLTFPNGDRRKKAKAAHHSRKQRVKESFPMYCEGNERLFKRADPHRAEEKFRHLIRGVKMELFAGLVRNPPRSVAEFITEATTLEKTLHQP